MKQTTVLLFLCVLIYFSGHTQSNWQGKRITATENQNESNTWINFRKDIELNSIPGSAMAKIACDSKYWLWINGELVVFEGQLKRGPSPENTYYDEVEIAPYLKKGDNKIAVLVWYFGKDGFSHRSSGQAGLAFDCPAIDLFSDGSWSTRLDKAFGDTGHPKPNYRLSESNIKFDARIGNFEWIELKHLRGFSRAKLIGEAESAPWNKLIKRPIPLWKDYGVREYENQHEIPNEGTGDWIICELPYNCHITPILEVDAPEGQTIKIQTDNTDYMGWNVASVRAEYVTKDGKQRYESLGWMNGHVVKYLVPKGVKIRKLSYRETGYNCEFTGTFKCSDPFYEKLWQMAVRTLYVTMRDTYMDCPDRERAQWWGDLVNESGEAFYALSPTAAAITKKGILELINWQRQDGTLYSPVPEGNWDKELPGQMLASVGYYGFWNYYLNTGDKATMAATYKGVKTYLDVWRLQENGVLVPRKGEWYWGDWGKDVDRQLLYNAWYYLALKGYYHMSLLLGEEDEALTTQEKMRLFKQSFNHVFWDRKGYRTKEYRGKYDDRGQALAVVSGLADENKYKDILQIFKRSYLASPYMEKYVLEALFMMEESEFGLERMKSRYYKMVEESPWTTLYENFGDKSKELGHGTNNHAWSGGGLTILAQYVCGLEPVEPGWKVFRVKPQLGYLDYAETGNLTVAGEVLVKIQKNKDGMDIHLEVPEGSTAILCLPDSFESVLVNGQMRKPDSSEEGLCSFSLQGGVYEVGAKQ